MKKVFLPIPELFSIYAMQFFRTVLIVGLNHKYFQVQKKNGDAVLDGFLPSPTLQPPNIIDIFEDLVDFLKSFQFVMLARKMW